MQLRYQKPCCGVKSSGDLPEGVIVTIVGLLNYSKERNCYKVNALGPKIVNRVVVLAPAGLGKNYLPAIRIHNDDFPRVASMENQAMVRFVKRHRGILPTLLRNGPLC